MTNVESMELLTYWLLALSTLIGWAFFALKQRFYTKEKVDELIESVKKDNKQFKSEYYTKQEEQEKLLIEFKTEMKHMVRAIEKLEIALTRQYEKEQ